MDRRVKKTRKELENALIRLLKKTSIQNISVKQLAEEADVTRATFYQHYKNPYDMLTEMQERILCQIKDIIKNTTGGDSYGFFLKLFTFLEEEDVNAEILSFDNGSGSGYELIGNAIQNNYMLRWGDPFSKEQVKRYEYFRCYILFGCVSIVEKWVENGKQESPEEMAKITFSLMPKEKMYLKG